MAKVEIKQDSNNDDLKRKRYIAVAAKMARVVYGIIKNVNTS